MKSFLLAFGVGALFGLTTQTGVHTPIRIAEASFTGVAPGLIGSGEPSDHARTTLKRRGRAVKGGRISETIRASNSGLKSGFSDHPASEAENLPNKLADPSFEFPTISQVIPWAFRHTVSMTTVLLNGEDSAGVPSKTASVMKHWEGSDSESICGAAPGICEQASLATPTSQVPEPDTLMLLGMGFVTFAVLFRFRRKR